MKEKQLNKIRLIGGLLVGFAFLITSISLIVLSAYLNLSKTWQTIILISSVFFLFVGIAGLCLLDWSIGDYECPKCHKRFIPTFWSYLIATHTVKKRHLRCPKCDNKSWCIKKLDDNKD